MSAFTIDLPAEVVEQIAKRAAEILGEKPVTGCNGCGYLDVPGAADFLACPVSRIYSLVSAKRIPFHKDGSRLLFDRQELREYVEAGGAVRP